MSYKLEQPYSITQRADFLVEHEQLKVARGDLGVEVPYEELPQIQKMLINKCRLASKRCITAVRL